MTGFAKKLEFILTMYFKISNKELLKKYDQIWKRIEKVLKTKFDSNPVYGDDEKYIKTKIKKYSDSVITNFHNKKIPKENAPCNCLSIIMLDSVIKAKKKKVLSASIFRRMHIWTKKNKNREPYWWRCRKMWVRYWL